MEAIWDGISKAKAITREEAAFRHGLIDAAGGGGPPGRRSGDSGGEVVAS
jgi:hypothetical protein